jgi:hypothetical protein
VNKETESIRKGQGYHQGIPGRPKGREMIEATHFHGIITQSLNILFGIKEQSSSVKNRVGEWKRCFSHYDFRKTLGAT